MALKMPVYAVNFQEKTEFLTTLWPWTIFFMAQIMDLDSLENAVVKFALGWKV